MKKHDILLTSLVNASHQKKKKKKKKKCVVKQSEMYDSTYSY